MNSFKTKKGTEIPLLNLKGKDYLQVPWRVLWMREEHPAWTIRTLIDVNSDHTGCIATAEIIDESGRLLATAHKYEDQKGFQDFIEKSETGAIGRALALCGYGTQFAPELSEEARLADSPLEKKKETPPQFKESEALPDFSTGEVPPPKDEEFVVGKKYKGKKFSEALNDKNYLVWVADCMGKDLAKTHPNLKKFYSYAKFHGAI